MNRQSSLIKLYYSVTYKHTWYLHSISDHYWWSVVWYMLLHYIVNVHSPSYIEYIMVLFMVKVLRESETQNCDNRFLYSKVRSPPCFCSVLISLWYAHMFCQSDTSCLSPNNVVFLWQYDLNHIYILKEIYSSHNTHDIYTQHLHYSIYTTAYMINFVHF